MTRREAIRAVRSAYAEAGSRNGPACASADCLNLATQRVFWPVLPGDEYPVYCDHCAAWAKRVLKELGVRADSEPLPARPGAPRAVSLTEVPR